MSFKLAKTFWGRNELVQQSASQLRSSAVSDKQTVALPQSRSKTIHGVRASRFNQISKINSKCFAISSITVVIKCLT